MFCAVTKLFCVIIYVYHFLILDPATTLFGFVCLFCLMSRFDPHLLNDLCLRHSLPLSCCGVYFHYKRSRQINIVFPCDHFGSLRSHPTVFPAGSHTVSGSGAHSVIHFWYKQSNTYHCLTLQDWPIRFQLYAFSLALSINQHKSCKSNHWFQIKKNHLFLSLLTNTHK